LVTCTNVAGSAQWAVGASIHASAPADEFLAELRAALSPSWADKAEEIWRAHADSVL